MRRRALTIANVRRKVAASTTVGFGLELRWQNRRIADEKPGRLLLFGLGPGAALASAGPFPSGTTRLTPAEDNEEALLLGSPPIGLLDGPDATTSAREARLLDDASRECARKEFAKL
jgi:hypothetical protein